MSYSNAYTRNLEKWYWRIYLQDSNRETDIREYREYCGHGERGGESEMYGKNNMEAYIALCKIGSQWEFAVWLRNSNRGSVSTWRGEMGRKMRGSFKEKIHVEVWPKTAKLYKAIILKQKINFKKVLIFYHNFSHFSLILHMSNYIFFFKNLES